ncbi:MAG TPA: iron ABC transporter permease [Candidatus Acidoferrum sp.]|nr:iron ABC transporter permease [Candidatus Acidoferrum sp.]
MKIAKLVALVVVLALAMLLAIAVGSVTIPPDRVVAVLLHPNPNDPTSTIVWTLRLPRIAIAAAVGAALALAGTLLQALLRNPLVDPYLTGVSAGAGASVAVAVALGVAPAFLSPLGFVSGLITAVIVALLARRGSGLDRERLILAGVVLSSLLAAISTVALMAVAHDVTAETLLAWLAGSLGGRGWSDLAAASPELIGGALIGATTIPALNILRVGEARAEALGVDVVRLQWTLLVASTLLTAAAVALAGLVGFVGLVVPHLARRVVGEDLRLLVPAAVLTGASLVILADALARSVLPPAEIPLGVLLAFIGVPTFLVLYLRGVSRVYA